MVKHRKALLDSGCQMKILPYIILPVAVSKKIEAGGSFLLVYLLVPPNPSLSWLPVVGVALVCLPWGFWILTCLYRIISRAFGFRMIIGGGDFVAGGNEARSFNAAQTAGEAAGGNMESPGPARGGGGGAAVMGNQNPASNSSNDLSITSHESEMPLTRNMAT